MKTVFANSPTENGPCFSNAVASPPSSFLTFFFWTFLQQWKYSVNFYYLLITILVLIPGLSAVPAAAIIVPWLVSILFAIFVDMVDFFIDSRKDLETDKKPCAVVVPCLTPENDDGTILGRRLVSNTETGIRTIGVSWGEVVVGDLVRVSRNETICADILLLQTSTADGSATTDATTTAAASQAQGVPVLRHIRAPTQRFFDSNLGPYRAKISASIPAATSDFPLPFFRGELHIDGFPSTVLKPSNLALRGSRLRGADWVLGIVIYAGKDCFVHRFAPFPPTRPPSRLNGGLWLFTILALMCFQLLVCACLTLISSFLRFADPTPWYTQNIFDSDRSIFAVKHFLALFVRTSPMIPATLPLLRTVSSRFNTKFFPSRDHHMLAFVRNAEWLGCQVADCDQLPDLASARVLIADKTGTLTEGCLRLSDCVIPGTDFCSFEVGSTPQQQRQLRDWVREVVHPPQLQVLNPRHQANRAALFQFGVGLAVCHDAHVFSTDFVDTVSHQISLSSLRTSIEYGAESQDDAASVKGAAEIGFLLLQRTKDDVLTVVLPPPAHYSETSPLPPPMIFTVLHRWGVSEKCRYVTIVVQDESGAVSVFVRGADGDVLSLIREKGEFAREVTASIQAMGRKGRRTALLAWQRISKAVYENTLSNHSKDRGAWEVNLLLLGVCGFEDPMQAGVLETVKFFRKAECPVWIVSGDSADTTLAVAEAAGICSQDDILIRPSSNPTHSSNEREIVAGKAHNHLLRTLKACQKRNQAAAPLRRPVLFFVCGEDLDFLMADDLWPKVLAQVDGGVCCRLRSTQKADIVSSFQALQLSPIAVGDGGSDVPMLRASTLAVSIASNGEDTGATRVAVATVSRFRHLVPLLAVHARFAASRTVVILAISIFCGFVYAAFEVTHEILSGNVSSGPALDHRVLQFGHFVIISIPLVCSSTLDAPVPPETLFRTPTLFKRFREQSVVGFHLSKSVACWAVGGVCVGIVGCSISFSFQHFSWLESGHGISLGHIRFVYTSVALASCAIAFASFVHQWYVLVGFCFIFGIIITVVSFFIAGISAEEASDYFTTALSQGNEIILSPSGLWLIHISLICFACVAVVFPIRTGISALHRKKKVQGTLEEEVNLSNEVSNIKVQQEVWKDIQKKVEGERQRRYEEFHSFFENFLTRSRRRSRSRTRKR